MFQSYNENNTVKSRRHSDAFSETLRESFEFFKENNIQMLSNFTDILTEQTLFTQYKNYLTEGMTPDEAEQFDQIMDNSRFTMLQESTSNQITPLVGLSMPTVRKMWVRTAMKNAIPTETAKVPTFTISWMEPYTRDMDGTKNPLPQSLRDKTKSGGKPKLYDGFFDLPADSQNLMEKTVVDGVGASKANFDAIDANLFIDSAQVEVKKQDGTTELKTVKLSNAKLSVGSTEPTFYALVETTSNEDVPQVVTDTLFGAINLETGVFSLTSVKGLVKKANFRGYLTHENNARGQNVSFDVKRKDIRISTGEHINADLPIEFLQDSLALYNIDATVEVVDIMSNVVATKLDMEIIDFFEDSFRASGSPFVGKFDVKPTSGFAGSPTEWRSELRTTIEWWANRLKEYTLYNQGYFVVFGNPIDINLLPNVSWNFKAVEGERNGVNITYDFGVMTFNNVYQIVSSENVPQGKLTMFFVPNSDKYMTYKYYPYTFNIERGYINPQNSNVPSIMMTKRHTIEELIPMQVQIEILHNDGSLISSYAL